MEKLVSMNPATNTLIDYVAITPRESIHQIVQQAQAAKKPWKKLGVKKRIELLRPLVELFKKYETELCLLTSLEIGKTIKECREDFAADIHYFTEFLDNGASYIEDEVTVDEDHIQHRIVYEPRGVVACIVPWNFPLTNFLWSVMPNLIVGNTVVFKHSEECPLMGKKIEDIMNEYGKLPPGVFTEIFGGSETGWQLVNENIDMIWFIGSSRVGKKLYELAGKKQIKAILEMGGSNPAIVFADADLNIAIPKIVSGRFGNCGQVCDAIKRVIIHRSLYDVFISKLTKLVQEMNINAPEHETTHVGPLAAMRQADLLESQVNDSVREGAKVVIGGARSPNLTGAYYLPTILTNVTRNMRVWSEEVFGPVLPVVAFDTEEEAIDLANDTIYGLGAAVFTQDLELARRAAREIDAGFVDINNGSHWRQCNPFGGFKASGMGCEHGRLGFQELCLFKVIAEG